MAMTLSRRRRFLTSLELREPDMVPVCDSMDQYIAEQITGIKTEGYSGQAVLAKGSVWEAVLKNAIVTTKASWLLGHDASFVKDYWICSKEYTPKRIGESRFIDEWGRVMETRADTKTVWWVSGTVETEEELETYTPPDPSASGRFELVEKVANMAKEYNMAVLGSIHSGFTFAFEVRGGIDKLIIDMYRRPRFYNKLRDAIDEVCLEYEKMLLDAGIDALFMPDDYAESHGPFMSLEFFRKFEIPRMKRFITLAKNRGVPVIKHTDGNVYPILDDMIDAGIDGLHPIEPGAMDLADVKEKYGERLCLLGNVDCRYVLPFGSERDVRNDVRRCIDAAAKGGGYIMASSNSLHANCKVENIYTMLDETRKYGSYPLRRHGVRK
jgi:uroporphyrinogen decarboxylase